MGGLTPTCCLAGSSFSGVYGGLCTWGAPSSPSGGLSPELVETTAFPYQSAQGLISSSVAYKSVRPYQSAVSFLCQTSCCSGLHLHQNNRGAVGGLQGGSFCAAVSLGALSGALCSALAAGFGVACFVAALLSRASGEEEVGAYGAAGFWVLPCECSSLLVSVRGEASHHLMLCIPLPSSCAAPVWSKLFIRE